MKLITQIAVVLFIAAVLLHISCKKEYSCEKCYGKKPPVAIAGKDTTIFIPSDSASLNGSSSYDPDGTIVSYQWKKISGPVNFSFNSSTTAKTNVKNLAAGIYQFELTVTDNDALSSTDTISVSVALVVPINIPPVAKAGNDTSIQSYSNTCTAPPITIVLNGSNSYDIDGTIVNYSWIGPGTILNPNAAITTVNNLMVGTRMFILKVTDDKGAFAYDTVQITILLSSSRPLISTQLTPIGTLSIPRSGVAIAAAGNKILFAGGFDVNGDASSRVDIFDISTQAWTTADLSIPRWSIPAVTAGNKIFFAGGHTVNQADWDFFSNVDIYDVSTNTWSVAQLSERRMNLAAGVVGDKVFFAGGLGGPAGSPPQYVSNKVDIYNNTTNTWSTSTLSLARAGSTAVTSGNKIYFGGGNSVLTILTLSCNPTNQVDKYDNLTNTWSTSFLSQPLTGQAGISVGNNIYWAGGAQNNCNGPALYSSDVEIQDLSTQTSTFDCLFQPNGNFKAVMKGSKIVFFTSDGAITNKFDIYDTLTGLWSIGVLPQSMTNSILSYNNILYVSDGVSVFKLDF